MFDSLIIGGIFLILIILIIIKCCCNEYIIKKKQEEELQRQINTEILENGFNNLESLPPPYETISEDVLKRPQ